MTSRKLIICLLASMVMRSPLLLKMQHISFLTDVLCVKSYVNIKMLELGEEKASQEHKRFGAVVVSQKQCVWFINPTIREGQLYLPLTATQRNYQLMWTNF